jgi:hypothetical protein
VPAVWGRRYVFARARDRYADGAADGYRLAGLYKSGPVRRISRALPVATDRRRNLVAFLEEFDDATHVSVKRFDRRGRGRVCPVAGGTEAGGLAEEGSRVTDLAVDGDFVYWLSFHYTMGGPDFPFRVWRRRLPGSRCGRRGPKERGRELTTSTTSLAVDRGHVYYTSDPGGVFQATVPPPTYTPCPRC